MLYPTVSEIRSPWVSRRRGFGDDGGLVLRRHVPADATWHDRLWFAWDEAQLEAERAYEAWRVIRDRERYAAYRAAQDRADAAQDALAEAATAIAA